MDEYRIGSDETFKGDTFGGLVVAGVFCDEKLRERLKLIGVQDSKKLSDNQIILISRKIKEVIGEKNYFICNIYPKEYNNHSMTKLMNLLHRKVFDQIIKKKKIDSQRVIHIVDKYPGCNVGNLVETKAESKYIEVAAASIIAREEGLKQIEELSKKLGINIPKGSTHVSEALMFLKNSGKDPKEFVKMHFKNVIKVLK